MATAKQILGVLNRAAEFAMERDQDDTNQRAASFVAYFSGALRALGEPTAVTVLHRLLGIENCQPTDGA